MVCMDSSALKMKIHALVDSSDEETLQAIYQLLNESEYTEEFKNVLDEEQADYYKNKEVISKESMDNLIREILKK